MKLQKGVREVRRSLGPRNLCPLLQTLLKVLHDSEAPSTGRGLSYLPIQVFTTTLVTTIRDANVFRVISSIIL